MFYRRQRETGKTIKQDRVVKHFNLQIHNKQHEQLGSASETHNPKVGGSNPSPATIPKSRLRTSSSPLQPCNVVGRLYLPQESFGSPSCALPASEFGRIVSHRKSINRFTMHHAF